MPFLTPRERRTLEKLAQVVVPPSRKLPPVGPATLDRLERAAEAIGPEACAGLRSALWTLELSTLARRRRRFSSLDLEHRTLALDGWRRSPVMHPLLRGLVLSVKVAYLADRDVYEAVGCRWAAPAVTQDEEPRWLEGMIDGTELDPDEELECDVVVVGTGAGGAPVAATLAERGHAVLILEAGQHFTRSQFNGRPIDMMAKMYARHPQGVLLGNALLPVPAGQTVGGSTTVNSGTCFRTPDAVLRGWGEDFGLTALSPDTMAPYFEQVERDIDVQPAEQRYIGGPGRVIARGCDALGFSHGPLDRNAVGCDGQGLCCFGCPTDAKRSTNVTYVPMALERQAMLVTGARVQEVRTRGTSATGVVAEVRHPDGRRVRIRVRSRAVVLCCGTLSTPVLLLRNGLSNGSGMVGRNLSCHPATQALGLFEERIDPSETIPQGYGIHHFAHEGIRFEGGSVPIELPGAAMDEFGGNFLEVIEQYQHLSAFGFMLRDTSRGRIRLGPGGRVVGSYWFNREDTRKLTRGMEILCRVFLAAGAKAVYPGISRWPRVRSQDDVRRLIGARLPARAFDLSAYHPLGTARMGVDPARSVVDADHASHEVDGLYVVDGSAVPSSLGVNPQITIMALALRAGTLIDRRLAASG